MSFFRSSVLAATVAFFCCNALAQNTIDPKAKAIFDAYVSTARKVTSFDGITASGGTPVHVVMAFDPADDSTVKFRIETLKDGTPTRVITNNDQTTVVVDFTSKTYMDLGNTIDPVLEEVLQHFPQWLMDQKRGGEGGEHVPQPVSITLDPEQTLDGTPCDVVRLVREMTMMEGPPGGAKASDPANAKSIRLVTTLALARADNMPRRLTETFNMADGSPFGPPPTTLTYSRVKVNAAVDPALFTQTAPEGFARVDAPKEEDHAKQPDNVLVLREGKPVKDGATITKAPRGASGLAVKIGDKAPDFQLKLLDGTDVSMASLKGKVVVLDFWATWCGPCKQVMPTIQKLSDEFKDKGAVVLGVNTFERGDGAAKKYMDSKKFTYGCLLKGDPLAEAYGVTGIPTLILINKDGTIALAEVGVGGEPEKHLRAAITKALAN